MENNTHCRQFCNIDRASTVKEQPSLANLPTSSNLLQNHADIYEMFKLYPTTVFPIGHRRLLIFDQSKGESKDQSTNVSNVHEHEEEMHEDTEEIDALLCSDSENEFDDDDEEEEDSTAHSPVENKTDKVVEEALQTPVTLPSKRRRVEYENDVNALEDTASSTNCHSSVNGSRKKAKGEKIHDTVAVLRRIIPGGKGKDAASVLDEAIKYLKSLRLKAKGITTSKEKKEGQ